MSDFQTKHKLLFEAGVWPKAENIFVFRVGTCHGQWFTSKFAYHVLSVFNDKPGNGHLDDVFEWFEHSARRDKLALMIMDFFNQDFKRHCINKRGFAPVPNSDHLVKYL